MEKTHNLLYDKKIEMAYGRTGEAEIVHGKCDMTGEETYCIVVDTSNGEYGAMSISIDYINKELEKFKTK